MKLTILSLFIAGTLILVSCNSDSTQSRTSDDNPHAEGFDLAGSDPAAVELADSIMDAIGGRRNWDATRYISWNFFGRRDLTWDKHEGRARIESLPDTTIYLLNTKTGKGRVRIRGKEITETDSLNKLLKKANSILINDSYWLVMPFKLKDTGVTLKYLGEDSLTTGQPCNLIQMTFANIGDTPQNKYLVYVDLKDNLIKQWAFYENASQDTANFVRPWDNYKTYGGILLSADRSDGRGPKNVQVHTEMPDKIFTEF